MIDSYFSAILLVIGLVLEWTPPPQKYLLSEYFYTGEQPVSDSDSVKYGS